jgi:taurine dioxygenase
MSSLASKQGPRYRHTSGEEAPYETIGVEKLTPIIGAEITGVDLAGAISNRTMDEIHRALAENLVIFFRLAASSANCTFIPPRLMRLTIRR